MDRFRPHRVVLAATVLFFVVRALLALLRTGPIVVADEVGYLTNARIFAGGLPGQMADAPFYRGGYSLLITPVVAAVHDPEAAYRLVLVLNAAFAAALVPLLYLLLRRVLGASPAEAAWPAVAAGAYPSVTAFTQVALSENALLPLTTLWLLCIGWLAAARGTARSAAAAAAAGGVSGALLLVHGRMISAAAVTVVVLVVLRAQGRLGWLEPAVGLATLAVSLVVVQLVDRYLTRRNYGGRHVGEASQRLSNLESAHGLAATLRNLVGQSWYVLVATLGLLLLAALTLSPRAVAARLRRSDPAAVTLAAGVLTALALLLATALSFPDLVRPDMLVYGRYVEVVLPPLLAAALLRLARVGPRWTAVAVGAVAAATVATALLQAELGPHGAANAIDVSSLPFLIADVRPAAVVGAGFVACLCVAALALLARGRPSLLAPVVALLFVGPAIEAEQASVLVPEHAVYPAGWTSPSTAAPPGETVGYGGTAAGLSGLFTNQWFLHRNRVVLLEGRPTTRLVISSPDWGRRHPAYAPKLVWRDPAHHKAMFVLRRR